MYYFWKTKTADHWPFIICLLSIRCGSADAAGHEFQFNVTTCPLIDLIYAYAGNYLFILFDQCSNILLYNDS